MFDFVDLSLLAAISASSSYEDFASTYGPGPFSLGPAPTIDNDIPYYFNEDSPYFNTATAKYRRLQDTVPITTQDREHDGTYTSSNGLYAGRPPISNAIGVELGLATQDADSNTTQRTGIGFYIRSDHLCNKRYDASVKVQVA
jgi:hypothetical protein